MDKIKCLSQIGKKNTHQQYQWDKNLFEAYGFIDPHVFLLFFRHRKSRHWVSSGLGDIKLPPHPCQQPVPHHESSEVGADAAQRGRKRARHQREYGQDQQDGEDEEQGHANEEGRGQDEAEINGEAEIGQALLTHL